MRKYCRNSSIRDALRKEFKDYNDGWWWYYSGYYDSSWQEQYDEHNYGYITTNVYVNGGRYQPYREVDMDSIYSRERQRDRKIEKILNNSFEGDYTTTLRDFFNNGKV